MTTRSADEFFPLLDNAKLTPRYWATTSLMMLQLIFELYDFFIVGFLVSVIAPKWGLTFGQSSIMLLSVGLGTIVGALVMGKVADAIGRKVSIVFGGLLCAFGTGALALLPEGAWIGFAVLRFIVGFGLGGAGVSQITLLVEFTPTRYRTLLSSITLAPAALGVFVASLVASSFLDSWGWRGIAAFGALPAVISLLLWVIAPESARWLVSKGKVEQARTTAAGMLNKSRDEIPLPKAQLESAKPSAPLSELFGEKRRFIAVTLLYMGLNATSTGCLLWGPVIAAQLLKLRPSEVAGKFIYVSMLGIIGRIGFSFLAQGIGRRRAAQIGLYAAAATVFAAAIFHSGYLDALPLFLLFLIGGSLFWDGVWPAILPYAAEVFPVRLAARGVGLGQAAGGLGKIIGPLGLALIAGANNFITPKATADAVLPGFLFLGGCALVSGLALTLLGVESHGKALSLDD